VAVGLSASHSFDSGDIDFDPMMLLRQTDGRIFSCPTPHQAGQSELLSREQHFDVLM